MNQCRISLIILLLLLIINKINNLFHSNSLKADGYIVEIANIGIYKYNEIKPLKCPNSNENQTWSLLRNHNRFKSNESINSKRIKRLSREDCDNNLMTWSSKSNLNLVKRDGIYFYL